MPQTIPQNLQQNYVQPLGSSLNQGYLPQGYNLSGSTTYGQNLQRNNPQGINTQISYGFQNPNSQGYQSYGQSGTNDQIAQQIQSLQQQLQEIQTGSSTKKYTL